MDLFNDDCFNVLPKIKDKTIDLFILDLPYGQTACKWDSIIDLNEMWKHIKRIMKPNAIIIFFTTAKFGYSLIHSNPKWFRYDLVWEKSRKVGFLSANKMPLRKHELMYIFSKDNNYDLENERNKELREYAEKVLNYTGKTKTEIIKKLGQSLDHFLRIKSTQFGLPVKKNYEKLTELYKLNEMDGYLNYEELENKWEAEPQSTYNSQLEEGKPYTTQGKGKCGVYDIKRLKNENKGTRHPTTILKFNNPKKSLHRTQKPTDLLEWLIKSYSNENDLVCDFTMGSGSTGEACLNTNRRCVGVEKEEEIVKIAYNRLNRIL